MLLDPLSWYSHFWCCFIYISWMGIRPWRYLNDPTIVQLHLIYYMVRRDNTNINICYHGFQNQYLFGRSLFSHMEGAWVWAFISLYGSCRLPKDLYEYPLHLLLILNDIGYCGVNGRMCHLSAQEGEKWSLFWATTSTWCCHKLDVARRIYVNLIRWLPPLENMDAKLTRVAYKMSPT